MRAVSSLSPVSPRNLSRGDLRTLFLAVLGGALECYDFIVFLFVAEQLSHLFFPSDTASWLSKLQVYGIFFAGYLARPIGGVVMAHFGDRFGRKKIFSLGVFLMALPTLTIGLLPVYAQIGMAAPLLLLSMRVIQGVAMGGEVPGAWIFVAEHAPWGRVGLAVGCLTGGLNVGALLGSLLAASLHSALTPAQILDWGWRIPFLVGGVFGFVAVWLRRWLSETPVFSAMRERRALSGDLPIRDVLRNHLGGVLISMLATWMLAAACMILILMLPDLVRKPFRLAQDDVSLGNSVATFCLAFGCVFFGWLTDRVGIAWTLLIGSLSLLLGTYALYADLAAGGTYFLAWYPWVGFLVGTIAVVPRLMVAVFPPAIRYSGLSFAYNTTWAIFGVGTATLMSMSGERMDPIAPAHYVAIAAVASAGVSVYLLTRRQALSH